MTVDVGVILAVFAGAVSLVVTLGGVIALLFRLLINSKDKEMVALTINYERIVAEQTGLKQAYQKMSVETSKSAIDSINYYKNRLGEAPVPIVAPVIPRSNSPTTVTQEEAALLATLTARLEAMKLATGLPPTPTPPTTLNSGDVAELSKLLVPKEEETDKGM